MEEKLKDLFLKRYKIVIDSENQNTPLRKLGINSLEWVNLIVAIEQEFNCDIFSLCEDLSSLNTYNAIKGALEAAK